MIRRGLFLALCMMNHAAMADAAIGGPLRAKVDTSVRETLERTGVPSASIAIVRDRSVIYAQAYGRAQIDPSRPATNAMRYAVGSISKEFTAAALLLLRDAGRLSIDDAAGKHLSGLGPAAAASIRALLSHTAGVRDYWPQDYVFADMLTPVTAQQIVARWADEPLDFSPGEAWQYSNTGYVVAGMIAEREAGMPLFEFLRERIFAPLRMTSAYDVDAAPLPQADASGYTRYALGPPRPAVTTARGWLFAAGELAMTPTDLARWDLALIEGRLPMSAASRRDLTSEVQLNNGAGTQYALGLGVRLESGRRLLAHGGEVSGFTAANRIYPDDGIAIVVMVNEDGTGVSDTMAGDIANLVFLDSSADERAAEDGARQVFAGLQRGAIDPKWLTPNALAYFSKQALADFQSSLGPLHDPASFTLEQSNRRGGMLTHIFSVKFPGKDLKVVARQMPDGRFEQFTVSAE